MKLPEKLILPGHRMLKTSIAVVLCLFAYNFLGRDGTSLAITAAIICMQDSVEKSITLGKSRVIGTLLGGAAGAACVYLNIPQSGLFGLMACSFFGVILIIYVFNWIGIKQGIVISCLVFMKIVTEAGLSELSPLAYSIDRTIDTLIGIAISVAVNVTLFRPVERVEKNEDSKPIAMLDYEIVRKEHFRSSKWRGGETSELYIYPEDSFFLDKDFDFRISMATVEVAHTTFTKFPGYRRYIMPIEGQMGLKHTGFHQVELATFQKDCFKGEWDTQSTGKCRDFNLMVKDELSGGIDGVKDGYEGEFTTASHISFYCLHNNTRAVIKHGEEPIEEVLNQGDFLCIRGNTDKNHGQYTITINNPSFSSEFLVIKTECCPTMDKN